MTTAKPTKGPCIVSGLTSDNVTVHTMAIPSNIDSACKLQIADCFDKESQLSWEEMNSNANLIAEAFNVYTETSLTPRQLDDQRRELLEMLYLALPSIEESDKFNKPTHKLGPKVRALITKAKGETC